MLRSLKPKVLDDITFRGPDRISAFTSIPKRVNLGYRSGRSFSGLLIAKIVVVVFVAIFLVLGSVTAPTTHTFAANEESGPGEEREALEARLKELESQISEYEDRVLGYKKQGMTLENEVSSLNSKIAKLNLQIDNRQWLNSYLKPALRSQ